MGYESRVPDWRDPALSRTGIATDCRPRCLEHVGVAGKRDRFCVFLCRNICDVLPSAQSLCLQFLGHVSGCCSCHVLCRGAYRHHGTDPSGDWRHVAERYAVILALCADIRVYRFDSGFHNSETTPPNRKS